MSATTTEGEEDVSSLSVAQDKALSLIPIFSGLLSAYGSFQIIRMVLISKSSRRDESRSTCYKRIMLGLSICDLISSLALSLQAFLLPSDTSQRIWAIGNDVTCSIMGFFQQLSSSNIWYNGMLSFYFLLTIKYAIGEAKLAHLYEPWMHGLAIGFPLLTASVLAVLDKYGELKVGHWCWIAGDHAALIAYMVAGIPYFLFLLIIPINNIVVYRHVRRTIQTSALQREHSMTRAQSNESNESTFSNEQIREQQRELGRQEQCQNRQNQRLQAVALQGFLYVAGFLVSQLPTIVLRILAAALQMTSKDEAQFFPLLVLQAILLPLQSLFNYLIYSRGSYVREIE